MIKINLIPPQKKEEIRQSVRLRNALRWEIELSAIVLIFISMLLSINYIVRLNLASAEGFAGGDADKIKKISELDGRINEMNLKVAEADRARKGQLHWENFFQKLNENFSKNIKLNKIDTENHSVALSGTADTRESLIGFKESLGREECFFDIELPLSSLVTKEKGDFRLDFKIKEDCLK